MIPFTRLNIIFAISALFTCAIGLLWDARLGIPNLSIQIVFMQTILLVTNTEAKKYFRRKMRAIVGVELSENKDARVENVVDMNIIEIGPPDTSAPTPIFQPRSQSRLDKTSNTITPSPQELTILNKKANKTTNESEIILHVGKLENIEIDNDKTTSC